MLLTKKVKIKWSGGNKKHYESLGYVWTKQGDEFEVDVNHLAKNSNAIVMYSCDNDNCNEIITSTYKNYITYVKEDGKTYCNKCASKLFGRPKMLKTLLKKGKSFEDLCIERNRQDLLDRWDYEKNGCKPSEVSCNTHTEYWFKCDKYPDTHHSELKNLHNFAQHRNGSMDCKQCNSVAQSVIDMYDEEYLWKIWNKELNGDLDPWSIASGSRIEVWWNCPDDTKNHEPYLRDCQHSKRYKYKCPNCRDRKGKNNPNYNPNKTDEEREIDRNYPEYTQFIKDVMARDNYTCQITGKESTRDLAVHHIDSYNWCKEKRTDIDNGIVLCTEIHNLFHSIYGFGNNTEEQFNDFLEKIENGDIDISNIK